MSPKILTGDHRNAPDCSFLLDIMERGNRPSATRDPERADAVNGEVIAEIMVGSDMGVCGGSDVAQTATQDSPNRPEHAPTLLHRYRP